MNKYKFILFALYSTVRTLMILNIFLLSILLLVQPYIRNNNLWIFIFRGNSEDELNEGIFNVPGMYILILFLAIYLCHKLISTIYQYYINEWYLLLNNVNRWLLIIFITFLFSSIYIANLLIINCILDVDHIVNVAHAFCLFLGIFSLMNIYILLYIRYKFHIAFMTCLTWIIVTTRYSFDYNPLNMTLISRMDDMLSIYLYSYCLFITAIFVILFLVLQKDIYLKFQRGDEHL